MKYSNDPQRDTGRAATADRRPRRPHDEQCVRYTHELTPDAHDASGRLIVRVVPLLYGLAVGALLDDLAIGLSLGVAIAVAFDLMMGHKSLLRPLAMRFGALACPYLAALAKAAAHRAAGWGLPLPAGFGELRCGLNTVLRDPV